MPPYPPCEIAGNAARRSLRSPGSPIASNWRPWVGFCDPKELAGSTLLGWNVLCIIVFGQLELPAQVQRRGYKEGKCNAGGSISRDCSALCYSSSFLSEIILFSFLSFPRSLRDSNGELRSATELHLCFIGFGSQRAFHLSADSKTIKRNEEKQFASLLKA